MYFEVISTYHCLRSMFNDDHSGNDKSEHGVFDDMADDTIDCYA